MAQLAGKAKHLNGTANTSPDTLQFGASSRSILIDNIDSAGSLQVSFDKGTKFKNIATGKSLVIDVVNDSLVIKSDVGAVNYEILVTLG